MSLLSLFKKRPQFPGALDDPRGEKEKQKDFLFDEIVATAQPVSWVEKQPNQWRQYPVRSQGQAGSCVAHSGALLAGIIQEHRDGSFVDFSATDIYQKRSNHPAAGMWGVDAFNLMRNDGLTLEALMPSMDLTEEAIDLVPRRPHFAKVAQAFRLNEYVQYNPGSDFEKVASTIQKTGKGVMVWFRFDYNEWTDVPTIRTQTPSLHHSVVATDVAIFNGQRGIVIQDSWGLRTGINGRRFITEGFYRARNTFAAYSLAFRNVEGDISPFPTHYTFMRDLRFGMTNDPDVRRLQDILKREGLFPVNTESTGNYFEITRRAVLKYQIKYEIDSPSTLLELDGRIVGPRTRAHLSR